MIIPVHNNPQTGEELVRSIAVLFKGRVIGRKTLESQTQDPKPCRQCYSTGVNNAGQVCHNCGGMGEL